MYPQAISRIGEAATNPDDKLFKYHKKFGGYHRYGGGRVDQVLGRLRDGGKLTISDAVIEMLQRIANVEVGGCIQAINSYDDSLMSMGFMQWTMKYGRLQQFIKQASAAFQRHGIELGGSYTFSRKRRDGSIQKWIVSGIKGAPNKNDLRRLDWAKRFYAAGLDPDIIVEEVQFALTVIEENKKKIEKEAGSYFLPHYGRSVILRALIQETFNHRPAWLYAALKMAIARASKIGEVSTNQFLELVREAIRDVYRKNGLPQSAENLIYKTGYLKLKRASC